MGKILEEIAVTAVLSLAGCGDSTERHLNGYKITRVNDESAKTTMIRSEKRERNDLPETYISFVTADGNVVRANMQLSDPEQIKKYIRMGQVQEDFRTGDPK